MTEQNIMIVNESTGSRSYHFDHTFKTALQHAEDNLSRLTGTFSVYTRKTGIKWTRNGVPVIKEKYPGWAFLKQISH